MPHPAPDTQRHGGPGSSHQNQRDPSKSAATGHKGGADNAAPEPGMPTNTRSSGVSGGGGERDRHHTHDTGSKR